MAFYFDYFPTVNYDIKKNNKFELLTNITVRFKFKDLALTRNNIFFDYVVREGQRPDTLAFDFYGDSTLDWIVLLCNNIVDPIFDWPMDERTLTNYIKNKYTSIQSAKSTIHSYEKILNYQSITKDGTIIPERYLEVDETTYNSLSSNRRIVYKYNYEERLNEQKRHIKLINSNNVEDIVNEVSNILK